MDLREGPAGGREEDLLCLSHLRWDFVFQRPQHLMIRHARSRRVFFFEEPIREAGLAQPRLERSAASAPPGLSARGVTRCVPHLPAGLAPATETAELRRLVDGLCAAEGLRQPTLWYYTPMALGFTRHLAASAVVYDCMDELSSFAFAPPELREREAELFSRADLVLTGGYSLYEVKRRHHPNVHPLPSSVDAAHFRRARAAQPDPSDQAPIPRPRLGFFGVIDERMDLALLDAVARARPDWHLVLLGPVVKIDPAVLPRRDNIHYLGMKGYEELPAYLSGWDVALLPFARCAATRYISPTKTPEYLAAGRPVVSTAIPDVVRGYGAPGLVRIADAPADFVAAIAASLAEVRGLKQSMVDLHLRRTSWDATFERARALLERAAARRRTRADEHRGAEKQKAALASAASTSTDVQATV